MISRVGKFENQKYILERFESIDEFLKTIETRPISEQYSHDSTAKDVRSQHISDPRWTGVSSYNEAKEQFINGTKAKAEMKKAYETELDPRRRESVNAPCGCAPIVAHALMGIPNAMVDIRRKRVPKATRVVVNMSISASISAGRITEAGKKIIAAIGRLESEGVSTEILCTKDAQICSALSSCSIAIKNAGQAFNAARVSFAMSSPAFLRVFQFAHMSSQPDTPYSMGYGSAISYSFDHDKLQRYYQMAYGDGIFFDLAEVVRRGEGVIERAIAVWKKGR